MRKLLILIALGLGIMTWFVFNNEAATAKGLNILMLAIDSMYLFLLTFFWSSLRSRTSYGHLSNQNTTYGGGFGWSGSSSDSCGGGDSGGCGGGD